MKLVIYDKEKKIYLKHKASTRGELSEFIGSRNFYVDDKKYSVNDVFAEKDRNNSATGSIVGGIVGLFGGPIGIIIGGLTGGIIGFAADAEENKEVEKFNTSLY